jgi:LacI family transcriptional regulator
MQKQKNHVTIKDLAKIANVSIASVSRVINNDPSVSPDIRQAVDHAIEKLKYRPKTRAKNGKSNQVGLLIPDVTNPYFPLLIKGITNSALVHDLSVGLYNADLKHEIEAEHIQRMIQMGVDGLIYIPFHETVDSSLQNLIEDGFPVVFLDREVDLEPICSVTSDNEEGAYQATTYLLNLGHRDIVFISGLPHLSTSVTRLAGYRKGIAEFGLDLREDLILYGDTSLESGYRETRKLLESNKKFSAIFASNDMMAFGAWRALEEAGLSIPEDVSIVGYDDIPFASYSSLTTIAQPAHEIGRNAVLLLVDLMTKRRSAPQKIVLRDSLIIRKSCKKI